MVLGFGVMADSGLVAFERKLVGFRPRGALEFCRSRFLGGTFFRGFLADGGGMSVGDQDGLAVGDKLREAVSGLESDFRFLMVALSDDSSSAC